MDFIIPSPCGSEPKMAQNRASPQNLFFHFDCGLLLSDNVLSESSYSRIITTISETDALATAKDVIVAQVI